MKSRILLLALFSATLAVFTGCHNPRRPTPGDTAFGPGKESADWVDLTKQYGAGAEGLSLRDDAFSAANRQRVENLLASVYFDTDKSAIASTERPKIDEASEYMKGNPKDMLLIEGYCDWRGTREYNLALGDRRATGVRQYLIDLGVDPKRIQTLSQGDLKAQENATQQVMKEDRRASFVVLR
jgi:peptidoglycan-associated lipoprotein